MTHDRHRIGGSTARPEKIVLATFVGIIAVWGIWAELAGRPTGIAVVGEAAPPFEAERLRAGTGMVSFPPRMQPTLVTFWATWCSGCKSAIDQARQIRAEFGDSALTIVAVNIDTNFRRDKAIETADSIDSQIDWVFDNEQRIYRRYGNGALGQTYAVDSQGVVRGKFFGPTLSTQHVREVLAIRD